MPSPDCIRGWPPRAGIVYVRGESRAFLTSQLRPAHGSTTLAGRRRSQRQSSLQWFCALNCPLPRRHHPRRAAGPDKRGLAWVGAVVMVRGKGDHSRIHKCPLPDPQMHPDHLKDLGVPLLFLGNLRRQLQVLPWRILSWKDQLLKRKQTLS